MKNLKQFYYRDYFNGIKWEKIESPNLDGVSILEMEELKKIVERKKSEIAEYNEPIFKIANQELIKYKLSQHASDLLNFKKWEGQIASKYSAIQLKTVYPGLFTGVGYNHETGNIGEFKLGFFFDHTTGLPILPGSSVKGVLRSVFPNFRGKDLLTENLEPSILQKNKASFVVKELFKLIEIEEDEILKIAHQIELAIFEGVDFQSTIQTRETAQRNNDIDTNAIVCYLPMPKHDIFLEAFISKGNIKGNILGTDAITPHGNNPLKNPKPLPFLKVLPDVEFTFQFLLNDSILPNGTEILKKEKEKAFTEILTMFGVGAKTNVGYGQFVNSPVNKTSDVLEDEVIARQIFESEVFEKKPKMGDSLQAKVIEMNKVEIRTKTEVWIAKMTGNCPPVGTVVNARINGLDKTGKVNQVSYQGNVR